MKNQITTFNFQSNNIRTLEVDGEILFVAADVCEVLDLDAKYACSRLDEDEKTYVARTDLGLKPGRAMYAVTESGLYNLIMRSDKPQAKAFQNWVTREVLPSIRKTGAYVVGQPSVSEVGNISSTMHHLRHYKANLRFSHGVA